MTQRSERIHELMASPQGKNVLTFLVFLAISSVLWIVMALNEETQRDLRCKVSIANVPDSVTQITPLPENFNVNIRGQGISLIRYMFSKEVYMNIDYRNFINANTIRMNEAALKAFFRARLGNNAQIQSVSPDSLLIYFTSYKGVRVPVKVDAHVIPGPQFAIIGKVRSLTDSVTIYSMNPADSKIKSISTAPIVLNDVRSSQALKVPLLNKPFTRAIPDSVDVLIEVEPLISKTRYVEITPINVPQGYRMIPVPSRVEVYYMVPMSIYKSVDSNPSFTIQADYNSISPNDGKVAVNLKSAPKDFFNVFVDVDSVEYILEKRE